MAEMSRSQSLPSVMQAVRAGHAYQRPIPMFIPMLACGTQLTSMTPGKGICRSEVDHYDIVPQLVVGKILANAKRPVDEEEE